MQLLNPRRYDRFFPDDRSRQIMRNTIAWFEDRELKQIKQDDFGRPWHANSLDFVNRESRLSPPARIFCDRARLRAACACGFPFAP
jgi:acyl-CoA dehydrogenase